jgi:hypothetical protein
MQNNTQNALENKKNVPIHTIKVSEEIKKEIFSNVENSYKIDINEMINSKTCWRRTGLTFETLSKITVAIGGVLSFSSGYFGSNMLSFISGSVSVLSLSFLQFGTFGFKQSKKKSHDLNILLKKLDLDTVPIIDDEQGVLTSGNNKSINNSKGIIDYNYENDTETKEHKTSERLDMKNIEIELNAIGKDDFV